MFKSSSIIKTNVAALLVAFSALSFAGDSYIAASVGFVDAYEKVTAFLAATALTSRLPVAPCGTWSLFSWASSGLRFAKQRSFLEE